MAEWSVVSTDGKRVETTVEYLALLMVAQLVAMWVLWMVDVLIVKLGASKVVHWVSRQVEKAVEVGLKDGCLVGCAEGCVDGKIEG